MCIRDSSVSDGATVPLYYENRIPELQLENENFDEELEDLLDQADLDEAQEKAVSRRFSQQFQLIKRPQRLEDIAIDLVEHFANRGFLGKAMYVATTRRLPCGCMAWSPPSGSATSRS